MCVPNILSSVFLDAGISHLSISEDPVERILVSFKVWRKVCVCVSLRRKVGESFDNEYSL